jgi:hypothetical protein
MEARNIVFCGQHLALLLLLPAPVPIFAVFVTVLLHGTSAVPFAAIGALTLWGIRSYHHNVPYPQ